MQGVLSIEETLCRFWFRQRQPEDIVQGAANPGQKEWGFREKCRKHMSIWHVLHTSYFTEDMHTTFKLAQSPKQKSLHFTIPHRLTIRSKIEKRILGYTKRKCDEKKKIPKKIGSVSLKSVSSLVQGPC